MEDKIYLSLLIGSITLICSSDAAPRNKCVLIGAAIALILIIWIFDFNYLNENNQ
jgi:hypothetical protein